MRENVEHNLRIDHITFTRFIAALTVVFFHYGGQAFPLNIPFLENVLKAGPIAVNYFYLLSGFIMAIAYYSNDPEDQSGFNKKKYWLARFARIYPVYLVALMLVALAQYKNPSLGIELLLNLSMLQSWLPGYPLSLNSPGWSLSVEAFFYVCFPFLLVYIYRHGLKKITLFVVVFWFLTQLVHTALLNSADYTSRNAVHDFIYYNPLMHLNAFVLGLVAGVYFKQNGSLVQTMRRYATPGMIVSLLLACLVMAFQQEIEAIVGFDFALTNGLLGPLFLLFIVFLACNTGKTAKAFQHPWLVLLGEASFSLYILQRPVHGIYEKMIGQYLGLSDALDFYLYLLFLIAISLLSFKLYEIPARYYIRRLPIGWASGHASNKEASVEAR